MSNIIKLADTPQGQSKALGKHFETTDQSITNGAIAHYGNIVKADYQEGICGHIEWTVSPLANAANNAANIALDALKLGRTQDDQMKALRIIRELLLDGAYEYEKLLEIKKSDHEGE
ncbi:MAG: hypothetical protein JJ964_14055 [Rhizobiales bacterium]|nr:hypothetical protein [Hyphomicrobiales bacterium]